MDDSRQGEVLFRETQWYQPRWLWGLVLGVAATLWYWGGAHGFLHHPLRHILFFISLIGLGVIAPIFLCTYRQVTEVRRDGIHVTRSPFPRSSAVIPFSGFFRYQPRICAPIYAAGGWGIAEGTKGQAFNMGGPDAVEFFLVGGGKVLIGSCRQREFLDALHFVCRPTRTHGARNLSTA